MPIETLTVQIWDMSHSTAGSFPAGWVPQSMLWSLADMPERSRFVVPVQGDVARIRGEVTVHAAIAGSIVPGVAKPPGLVGISAIWPSLWAWRAVRCLPRSRDV